MVELRVALGERGYPIRIGSGLLERAELSEIGAAPALIVTNTIVAPRYLNRVYDALADGRHVEALVLPDGEAYKRMAAVETIHTRLLAGGYSRDSTVIALGGGVIGDIAGFAAATYQRGIAYVQLPTTLLAQVDSSVGGKTGVNHPLGKNMVGAFFQPQAVVADVETLASLPRREFAAGLAEIIKYGLIRDAAFFEWLEARIERLVQRDAATLIEAIRRSCQNKADVVAADEREAGPRAFLNLGHTFGHALEAELGYGRWLHGEAVAAGVCMAAYTSRRLGWLDAADRARIERLFAAAGLPLAPPPTLAAAPFKAAMGRDKKARAGQLHLVLLRAIGDAVVAPADPAALDATLARYLR